MQYVPSKSTTRTSLDVQGNNISVVQIEQFFDEVDRRRGPQRDLVHVEADVVDG